MRPSYVYVGTLKAQLFATSCNVQVLSLCPHSVLGVLYGSENKQRLFLYTALTDWFL